MIFVFDELDKLGDNKINNSDGTKRDLIEDFLGRMKAILSSKHCRFIFIGDREIVDNYHSESGSKNALYEGVFDQIFYVPSLLSDYSDKRPNVLHSMVFEYTMNILLGPKQMEEFYDEAGFAVSPKEDKADSKQLNPVSRSEQIQNKYLNWIDKNNVLTESEKNNYLFGMCLRSRRFICGLFFGTGPSDVSVW